MIRSNRRAVELQMKSLLSRRMEAAAINVEGAAKSLCPVDSGDLRANISHAPANGSETDYSDGAVIGNNLYYAPFVELGTVDSAPQPYLVPALMATKDTTQAFLNGTI